MQRVSIFELEYLRSDIRHMMLNSVQIDDYLDDRILIRLHKHHNYLSFDFSYKDSLVCYCNEEDTEINDSWHLGYNTTTKVRDFITFDQILQGIEFICKVLGAKQIRLIDASQISPLKYKEQLRKKEKLQGLYEKRGYHLPKKMRKFRNKMFMYKAQFNIELGYFTKILSPY